LRKSETKEPFRPVQQEVKKTGRVIDYFPFSLYGDFPAGSDFFSRNVKYLRIT
jgi:hypothetical protein